MKLGELAFSMSSGNATLSTSIIMTDAGMRPESSIDVIAFDPTTDECVLVIVEKRAWGSSPRPLLELQEKLNMYLAFALDGEMFRKLPEAEGKGVRIRLDCATQPEEQVPRFLRVASEKMRELSVTFEVRLLGDGLNLADPARVSIAGETVSIGPQCRRKVSRIVMNHPTLVPPAHRSADFWTSFAAVSGSLRTQALGGGLDHVFRQIQALLARHGLDWAFEITTDEHGNAVLAFTPGGDREVAQSIDALLAIQPVIPNWRIFGRRQRKPLADAYVFVREIYGIDLTRELFELEGKRDGYVVTMISDQAADFDDEEARGLVSTLLDHALGEDVVMEKVQELRTSRSRAGDQMTLAELRDILLLQD